MDVSLEQSWENNEPMNLVSMLRTDSFSGKLIRGTAGINGPKVDELATRIEDALALCL